MKYLKTIKDAIFCLLAISIFSTPSVLKAQIAPKKATSSDIYDALKKLQVLGTVMYVAAHPDDENTRLISYFANARYMDVTYLSLTRGDGGQNLIGTELREYLGALRTQELLMARATDGGKQLFSRANDFGFSKSPAETLRFWGKDDILSDVVWAIRKVQPDIIINRFSIDTAFDTHGHHTSSAILSNEAFDIVGSATAFPEQMKFGVQPWQPQRLFHNISWFWFGSQEKFNDYVKKEQTISLDAGIFLPTRGKSNDEIAAESRSMHKCQGMGMTSSRGSNLEYLQYLKGAKGDVKAAKDPLEGMNTTWSRLAGGEPVGKMLNEIERNFRLDDPSASVSPLLKVRKMIQNLPETNWKKKKLADIEKVIGWCAGIFCEATTKEAVYNGKGNLIVNYEAINRSNTNVLLKNIQVTDNPIGQKSSIIKSNPFTNITLSNNKVFTKADTLAYPVEISAPYWLLERPSLGKYNVSNQYLRGLPETPRRGKVQFVLNIEGEEITFETDVVNRYANPAKGEIYRPLEVTPSVFVNLTEKVYVFASNEPKNVQFVVKSAGEKTTGSLQPNVPTGWTIEPQKQDFNLKQKGEEQILTFKLTPLKSEGDAILSAKVFLANDTKGFAAQSVRMIEYDHIPTQTVLQPAEAKVVKINIEKRGNNIGYYMGAGDDMPACLAQIDYNITMIGDHDFQSADGLARFDAIVLGIRAYNTKEKLKFYNAKLLDYVKNGGTVVVQYNTNGRDLLVSDFGPFPLKLGRGRTTEEDTEIRILKPDHPVLNSPNKITKKDFDGWVQERGLYFLSEWDAQYETILSCNDVGEKKEDGGLVIGKHGKGYFIYTGYSFFRQMPAGVAGAYRLFANLLSLGKQLP
jgi:LmbE family N-acetylglucosaminyl deacetylase